MNQYIYLLQEREFIKTNEIIYKVGKTKQENLKRLHNYPNGSKLIFQSVCNNCDICEKNILKEFREQFILKKDIGNEYFEGDYIKMLEIIYKICFNSLNKIDDTLLEATDTLLEATDTLLESHDSLSEISSDKVTVECYEDFIKYTNIEEIIINNQKTKEGFIRLKKYNSWIKLHDCNSNSYNETKMENLESFINIEASYVYDYGIIEFDLKSIITDIIIKCFISNCKEYILKHNEYFILTNTQHTHAILDTYNLNIQDYTNDIAKEKILECINGKSIHFSDFSLKNINIEIVEKILKKFIQNDDNYNQYKSICYNTIVSQKYTNIYYANDYLLTSFLKYLLCVLCGDYCNTYEYPAYIDSEQYLKNKKYYIKLFKTYKPKIVFTTKKIYTENLKTELINLGIRNIFISNEHENGYDKFKNCIQYVIPDILDIVNKEILDDELYITKDYIEKFHDCIFEKSKLLLKNFIKWTCIK